MRLSDYLERTNTTLEQLGAKLGVSHTTVHRWAHGRHIPRSKGLMEALVKATGGAVTPADFFAAPKPPSSGLAEDRSSFAAEVRALGLDPDAIATNALKEAIRAEKARQWQEENRAAIEAWNAWVDENGLPLEEYRLL